MLHRRLAWSDVATLSLCALVATSLLLVRVTHYRAAARRSQCTTNLRTIGLAMHNYHSAYKVLPMGSGGTYQGNLDHPLAGNASRLSPYVALSPFCEQQRLWEQIANPMQAGGKKFRPMGPVPWYDPKIYTPWGQRPIAFVCPADEGIKKFSTAAGYAFNYGDGVFSVGAPAAVEYKPKDDDDDVPRMDLSSYAEEKAAKRGTFQRARALRFRDMLDGLSNTLLVAESRIGGPKVAKDVAGLALDPSQCIAVREEATTKHWPEGRSACWADGSLRSTGFQTILPPNSPSATSDNGELEGVMSASSMHGGGVHILFGDGAVQFATNSIDAGDPSTASVAMPAVNRDAYTKPGSKSPYGLWGALGTRASKELVRKGDTIIDPPTELTEREIAEVQAKPLQDWTSADGKKTFRARQVDLVNRSQVILLTEQGDTKRIGLSALDSDHAYRAVAQHTQQTREAQRNLRADLGKAVKLLEEKKFDEFVEQFFDVEANEQVLKVIAQQRGILIFQFETAIRAIGSPNQNETVRTDPSGNRVRIHFTATRMGDLNLQRFGDRWKITK